MEVKRDILWRVYLAFIGIVAFSLVILGRAIYIQRIQGSYWIAQAKEQQQRYVDIDAQRGTIYSEDGSMLSTSIPFFDIYIDFGADGLHEKNGQRFKENLDSLSLSFATFFDDRPAAEYKRDLQAGYRKRDRYFLLKRNISFQQYGVIRNFPLVRLGKNKSGFIAEEKSKRLNPFGMLANRTIGLSREYTDSAGKTKNTNVGLEKTYDLLLKGQSGKRLVRFMGGGVFVPVEGSEIDPENGKDIVTTLDVNIQDIAESALLKELQTNECEYGTCIVMEVKTGKVKAIANLGKRTDGTYWEDLNYAVRASEPGSTFKLATLLSLLEDKYVSLSNRVNLEGGRWQVNGRTVHDAEESGLQDVSVKEAFEHSSNVGMAKLVMSHYAGNPLQYISRLKALRFDQPSGIDLLGEAAPVVKTPRSRTWSATSLPWMAFGYEVLVSPLQTLMLYNAVANNGKMMKPYLVQSVQENGLTIKQTEPKALVESICSDATLRQLQECLRGVCSNEAGTAYRVFKGAAYSAAGKTGTAQVANGSHGYDEHIYQSSFAGYFPADDPLYSCIVVIRNKPFSKEYLGAKVAGPVFREVADKLYALSADKDQHRLPTAPMVMDSTRYAFAGSLDDMKQVLGDLKLAYTDSAGKIEWARLNGVSNQRTISGEAIAKNRMPDVRGMGLKDALYLLENMNLKVMAGGKGKVKTQSIEPGVAVNSNQAVTLLLN